MKSSSGAPADSRSSQGLTRVGRQTESMDRGASLTMARKAMKLKGGDDRNREISARRQVGDAETMVNQHAGVNAGGQAPWWRNVGMEDAL